MSAAALSNVIDFPHRAGASDAAQLERHRLERLRRLERENEMLRADRDRVERVLALCLQVAVGETGADPLALLEVLYAFIGSDPARPAWVEHRERMTAKAQGEMVLRVLQETRP